MQRQRKARQEASQNKGVRTQSAPKPVFIAAVRFSDGRRDVYTVLNANDAEDARQTVLYDLVDSVTVMVALKV